MQDDSPQNHDLTARIEAHVLTTPDRVSSLDLSGQKIWIKRVEHHKPIRRLQKGNASAAFERERQALHVLGAHGQPVPQIVAEGRDWFAIGDCGVPISRLICDQTRTAEERIAIFAKAGAALADLHRAGFSHGRPNLKDICWDGAVIRFLDFERFAEHRNTPKGHIQDLLMFVFNALALAREPTPELAAAIDAYRSAAPADIWRSAVDWCQKWRWIIRLTAPVRLLSNSREFQAIPMTFQYFLSRD